MPTPPFKPMTRIEGFAVHIGLDDVDTDQIYPARFLSTTSRRDLGRYAFFDWRHDTEGLLNGDEPLNRLPPSGRRILLVGRNFGCGSSREHAPWALHDFGVRVILGCEMADIFCNNCLTNGIAAIRISSSQYETLQAALDAPLTIDLETRTIKSAAGPEFTFSMEDLSRQCLLTGLDPLGLLLDAAAEIEAYEASRPPP